MTSFATLTASRLSISNCNKSKSIVNNPEKFQDQSFRIVYKKEEYLNLSKQGNPFILSKASKRKLFDSFNYLYNLSKPRAVSMQNGKSIFNFRASFITLTLPSPQVHSDVYIKNNHINQLLVELKKHYNLNNFIWKAELQRNDNIHFHLCTDVYIDFQALRRRWNRIIEKDGYISEYRKKMSAMSPSEYHKQRVNNYRKYNNNSEMAPEPSFKESFSIYMKQKKDNWSNPNSVDVRSIKTNKDLAVYLSKYICKNVSKKEQTTELTERQKNFGRSWSRSYSLVKMTEPKRIDFIEIKDLYNYLVKQKDKVQHYTNIFCDVIYFKLDKLHRSCSDYILNWLKRIAINIGYILPVS